MSQPPVYGGDEISALVLDPGSCWTRAGFAGEDTPKCLVSTALGVPPAADADGKKNYIIGENSVYVPREGVEVQNPMSEGIVEDWEGSTELWKWCFYNRLRTDPTEHPLLMTEASWNPPKSRERTMEAAFESLGVPAFFLAKQGVCSAFASGKSSALVVDVGAEIASVTPVYDGIVLRKGVVKQRLAGNFIDQMIQYHLEQQGIDLTAQYKIASKTEVDVGKAPIYTLKSNIPAVTTSYDMFQRRRLLHEFKECMCHVFETSYDERLAAERPTKTFEFPTGYRQAFGADRYLFCEPLFNPAVAYNATPETKAPEGAVGLAQLVHQAVAACDSDLRASMLSNIVVIGGTSLLPTFSERLQFEVSQLSPSARVRVHASGNTVERKCASWLGGSILASLGTFHQLWISRSEYDEVGPDRSLLIEKRCK